MMAASNKWLRLSQFSGFLAVGLPGFLLAIPANYLLVNQLGCSLQLSYAFVLIFQIGLNYILLRSFVFKAKNRQVSYMKESLAYFAIIFSFRTLDFFLYSLLTGLMPSVFIQVQVLNTVLFSVSKFTATRKLLRA